VKAVIIRFSSLGDIVLATAALEALWKNNVKIAFVTKSDYKDLFAADPRVSRLILFETIAKLRAQIKEFSPDWIVDLHANLRGFLSTIGLGIPTARVKKHNLKRRFLVWFGIGSKAPHSVVDDISDVVKKIGYNISTPFLPKLYPSERGRKSADKIVADIPRPLAIIHPGARYPLKNWGYENFVKLAKIFMQNGFSVLFIGKAPEGSGIHSSGELTLEELVALLALGDIFVGNDSGPAHIAAALSVPTITVFGPTHPALGFVPMGKYASYVYSDIKCSPCSLHGEGRCKFEVRKCFESITPDLVFERAVDVYNKKKYDEESAKTS